MKRSTTDSFVITLRLFTNKKNEKYLNDCFFYAFLMHNKLIKYANKQYSKLLMDPLYKNSSGKDRTVLIKKYSLTLYDFEKYIKVLQKKYKNYIGSLPAQTIAKDVYSGIEAILYKGGHELHFKKLKDIVSISNKNNDSKLVFKNNQLILNKVKFNVSRRFSKNSYIPYVLENNRIKFVRIIRKPFNNGYHYYAELVMEGTSPKKVNMGDNDGGIDIGTSTIAFSSNDKVMLKELAPNAKNYDKKIAFYQQKMDKSKYISNFDNYNKDGTIRKNTKNFKKTWVYTKNYYKYLWLLRNLYRKKSAYIKQHHNELANEIISHCNTIYVENMNFKALQRKAKQTKKSEKLSTIKDSKGNEKQIHKYKKKKRFGKSICNRAPAMLITIIKQKLESNGGILFKVDTKEFKASQYNHITNTYEKKKLYERENIINNIWIQRDLYSAFLLMNSKDNLKSTDREKCIKTFDNFVKLHNECIANIKLNNIKHPTSFGF